MLLIETIFDTLNAKAAIFAVEAAFDELGFRVPVMISGTITDASGRTLSGQTVEAFWTSVVHARPLAVGLNCALGARQLAATSPELSRIAELPGQRLSERRPAQRVRRLRRAARDHGRAARQFARDGLVNIVGGCCGTTPAHIRGHRRGSRRRRRRAPSPASSASTRLSGLGAADHPAPGRSSSTSASGPTSPARASSRGSSWRTDYEEAVEVARQQVESGAQVIDINMDEALLDSEAAMARFLNLIAAEPDIGTVPVMIDSSKWTVIEAGLKCVQGRRVVNSISLKEGEDRVPAPGAAGRRYGAAVVVMAFDEQGQADTADRKVAIAHRAPTGC